MFEKIATVAGLVKGAPSALDRLQAASERIGVSTVRLAVTGLSRAGKTVFITSLIHNLMSAAGSRGRARRMPLLRAASDGRLLSASLPACGARAVVPFPY